MRILCPVSYLAGVEADSDGGLDIDKTVPNLTAREDKSVPAFYNLDGISTTQSLRLIPVIDMIKETSHAGPVSRVGQVIVRIVQKPSDGAVESASNKAVIASLVDARIITASCYHADIFTIFRMISNVETNHAVLDIAVGYKESLTERPSRVILVNCGSRKSLKPASVNDARCIQGVRGVIDKTDSVPCSDS